MKKVGEIALGIMTALGGFIDIGEMVFTTAAGARTGHRLIWVIALGTLGIIVFSEMSGRIAAVTRKPVFSLIRERLPFRLGLASWIGSTAINVITCAAELGGVALLLRYFFPLPAGALAAVSIAVLVTLIATLRFKWIERVFGFAGLTMLIFPVAMLAHGVAWPDAARGLVPTLDIGSGDGLLRSAYFAVGIFSSVMMPYEVYFYSSGAIEDEWKPQDLRLNNGMNTVGFVLGGALAASLLLIGAQVFAPAGITPGLAGTVALMPAAQLGRWGAMLAIAGMLSAVAGAAVETGLASGYDFAQFFRFEWGRKKPLRKTPEFDAAWIATLAVGGALLATGVDPIDLVEASVIGAVLVLPVTYFTVLRAAGDPELMGKHVNGKVDRVVGWAFFGLVTVAAVSAVPLMVLTHGGHR